MAIEEKSKIESSDMSKQEKDLASRYCSWCFEKTTHVLIDEGYFSRNSYICEACQNHTLPCRIWGCHNMTKGTPRERSSGFMAGVADDWHDEFCAEHDGTIASFEKLGLQLNDITEYHDLFEGDTWNWATHAKIAAGVVGGAVIVAPAAFLAAPGIAATLGSWGLLGASGTGTAISTLSGASLTNASLAAIGGGTVAAGGAGIAGGTILLCACGGAIGGIRGGVIANRYFGQIDNFGIHQLDKGKVDTLFVNGFLQQNESEFKDWSSGLEAVFPGRQTYGVTWESKTLRDLGGAIIDSSKSTFAGLAKRAIIDAKRARGRATGPMSLVDLMLSLIDNPWHVAMSKAGMTGVLLAEIISRSTTNDFTLMGHSLGSRVIFYTLLNLSMKDTKSISNVYLFGGAVERRNSNEWNRVTEAITGKVFNFWSENDSVLKYLYEPANALLSNPIGLGPIELEHPKIINVNCTEFIGSHMAYKLKLPEILRGIDG